MPRSKPEPAHILVVEDDRKTADLVALYLRHDGHRVSVAHAGSAALRRVEEEPFDLLVLDVMLPGVDGLEICRRVRARSATPIILLTARVLEDERVEGLERGADDYVTKPFSPRELAARVRALLRRVPPGAADVLRAGALTLERGARRVRIAGRDVELTPSEFALLEALLRRPGQVLSRRQLLEHLPTPGGPPLDRTVDVHVRNVRRKLERAAGDAHPDAGRLETVHGIGYRVLPDDPGGRP